MMNIAKKIGIKQKLVIAMLLPLLTSCATYNSGFSCGDARGVACTPMEKVNQLIVSGEIEAYVNKKKKCRGRSCTIAKQRNTLQEALSSKQRR